MVSYTLNPQVHAFDNASMTETLAAQPETVRSARAIVGDRPLVVGPITLRPPFNPNATGPTRNRRRASFPPRSITVSHRYSPPAGLPEASTRSATPVWMRLPTSKRPAGED